MSTTASSTTRSTAETIQLFNQAFRRRDKRALADLVHDDCVMVAAQPAPDGLAYRGKDACVRFWAALLDDESASFEVEDTFAADEWATVRWRYRFGPTDTESVLGVNVTRVADGQVIEQLGYTKTPGGLPLPE